MKKLVTIVALTTICVGAFAQGKIAFANNSLHSYYMTTDTKFLKEGDVALAGARTPVSGLLAGGTRLVVDLYGGTTAGNLSFIVSTSMSTLGAGSQSSANITLPTQAGYAGGNTLYFQYQIRDQAFLTADLARDGMSYYGYSSVFTAVLGIASNNNLTQLTTPTFSTWAVGTFQPVGAPAGYRGGIEVMAIVPEPSTFALAGLGAAAMLIFRRRK